MCPEAVDTDGGFFTGRLSSYLGVRGDIASRRQLFGVIQKTVLAGKRKAKITSGTATLALVSPGQLTVGTSLEPKQQTPELMGMHTLLYLK